MAIKPAILGKNPRPPGYFFLRPPLGGEVPSEQVIAEAVMSAIIERLKRSQRGTLEFSQNAAQASVTGILLGGF
jgi:hypothetical protein